MLPISADESRDILCVGVNPAYQTTLHFDSVAIGKVNRAFRKTHSIGGKGQNAAIAISQLETKLKITLLQMIGGETGEHIKAAMAEKEIPQHNVLVQRKNRTCTTLLDLSRNLNTELVEPSELVTEAEYAQLLSESLALVRSDRFRAIALCGTLPPGVDAAFYSTLTLAKPDGCFLLMDAYRDIGVALASGKVDVLKINIDEAVELARSYPPLDPVYAGKNLARVIELGLQIILSCNIRYLVITDGGKGAQLFERIGSANTMQIYGTSFALPNLASVVFQMYNASQGCAGDGRVLRSALSALNLGSPNSPKRGLEAASGSDHAVAREDSKNDGDQLLSEGIVINTQLGKLRESRPTAPSPIGGSPPIQRKIISPRVSDLEIPDEPVMKAGAPPHVPLNTLGAGDTCSGVLLATYLIQGDMVEAVKCGLAAASASCLVTESTAHYEVSVYHAMAREIEIFPRTILTI